METKKLIAFGALAAGAVFLLSSFTGKKTDIETPGGEGGGTPDCTNANAETDYEAWLACQTNGGGGEGGGEGGEIPVTIPTWDNVKVIAFRNPFVVTVVTKKPADPNNPMSVLISYTDTYKVFGYSVTNGRFITDNWSVITPDARFNAGVPSWFVPRSSNLPTLIQTGRIVVINREPQWSLTPVGATGLRGTQMGPNNIGRHQFAYYNSGNMAQPIEPRFWPSSWDTLHTGVKYYHGDSIDIFGTVNTGKLTYYILSNKGILLTKGLPAQYTTSGLMGVRSI